MGGYRVVDMVTQSDRFSFLNAVEKPSFSEASTELTLKRYAGFLRGFIVIQFYYIICRV